MSSMPLDLDQIQGNIIGFNKDHQTFLFLRFPENGQAKVCGWLRDLVPQISTATDVLAFNQGFKALRKQQKGLEDTIAATWLNIAFTHAGLAALGTPSLDGLPDDFREGMRKRALCGKLGDTDDSAPDKWIYPEEGKPIHALLLIAADSTDDLKAEAGRQVTALFKAGICLIFKQDGMTLPGKLRGHEHFGFRDGISQPGILDDRIDPEEALQAGQDRVCPGEFVIGYPTAPTEEHDPCVAAVKPTPEWTKNGSYLVFRRLRQNVRGFRDFVSKTASDLNIGVDLMGAKLVGRYASGAPLAPLTKPIPDMKQPLAPGDNEDPGRIDPDSPLLNKEHINDFEFMDRDGGGEFVPRGAHIRKVYPRDQEAQDQPASDLKRILRRGIPFGASYQEGINEPEDDPEYSNDRGLLFICYQNSIEEKFEFLQQIWVNARNFPPPVKEGGSLPGQDPIISQRDAVRKFDIPGVKNGHIELMQRWVTTTGGDYFFSPSVQALDLFSGTLKERTHAMLTADELERNSETYEGEGICSILIAFTAKKLLVGQSEHEKDAWRSDGIYWEVCEGAQCVWKADQDDRLKVDGADVVTGRALVSVGALLQAVVDTHPDWDIKKLLAATLAKSDEAKRLYENFTIKVYVDTEPIILPIDMCVHGNC